MLITGDMLVCHLVGDYLLQSDWMATNKTKSSWPCLAHAFTYAIPFLFLTQSPWALAIIISTHFIIDRWRLARYLCWAKNLLAPKWIEVPVCTCQKMKDKYKEDDFECSRCGETKLIRSYPWKDCSVTGYPSNRPAWLTVWLMIFTDNTLHLIINGLALKWF